MPRLVILGQTPTAYKPYLPISSDKQTWQWKISLSGSVTGLWFGTFFIFPYVGKFITPTDELIFFRGVGIQTTNQVISSAWQVPSTMFRTKIWKDCHLCRPQLQQFAENLCSHRTLRISRYIMIYPRRTFGHFFLPSAPRQPHSPGSLQNSADLY